MRGPLVIHAPGWFENSERVEGLSNQISTLPTVLDMLSYEAENGEHSDYLPMPSTLSLRHAGPTRGRQISAGALHSTTTPYHSR